MKQLTMNQIVLIMTALESYADEPGYLSQDDIDSMLNLRDDVAAHDVWLSSR